MPADQNIGLFTSLQVAGVSAGVGVGAGVGRIMDGNIFWDKRMPRPVAAALWYKIFNI